MQFKYQDLGEGIIKLLKQRKQNGENIMVIRATEVKRLLDVQKICGPCRNGRYAVICQAEFQQNRLMEIMKVPIIH